MPIEHSATGGDLRPASETWRPGSAASRLFFGLALGAALFGGCGSDSPANADQSELPRPVGPAPTNDPLKRDFTNVGGLDSSANTLTVYQYATPASVAVNVGNLSVDLTCARKNVWYDYADLRVALLRSGCAVLENREAASQAERDAENQAKNQGIERWAPYPKASAPQPEASPSRFSAFLAWLKDNWDGLLGTILGLLGLSWVAAKIDKIRKGRKIDVVLTGLPSAGKTDLWTAWRNDMAPRSNASPTAGARRMTDLEPVPFGRYTIYPEIVDTAGGDPSLVVQQLQGKRRLAKQVLLVVLAPTRTNASSQQNAIDQSYILEQKGFINLPQALVGDTGKLKPALVVVFVSKFDLVSGHTPYDTSSSAALHEVETLFAPHRDAISSQCRKANIPFEWIVGSARKGWGVRELRDALRKVVTAK